MLCVVGVGWDLEIHRIFLRPHLGMWRALERASKKASAGTTDDTWREQATREVFVDLSLLAASDYIVGTCGSNLGYIVSHVQQARHLEQFGRRLHPPVHAIVAPVNMSGRPNPHHVSNCGREARMGSHVTYGGWSDAVAPAPLVGRA